MENIDIDTEDEHPHPHPSVDVHPIVQTVANMMNYLSVSLYEGQFTLKHEQARTRLNELYDHLSKTPLVAPSLSHSSEFYYNVNELRNVTETDYPDYHVYMRKLKKYIFT